VASYFCDNNTCIGVKWSHPTTVQGIVVLPPGGYASLTISAKPNSDTYRLDTRIEPTLVLPAFKGSFSCRGR
jgi:hypothetical protein